MVKKVREPIDEWKASDLLLKLVHIYSRLGPVWTKHEESENGGVEEEDGYSITVYELQYELGQLYKVTPDPFHERILQMIKDINTAFVGYEKTKKLVPRESETGERIFEIIQEICDYLRNSWRKLYEIEERVLNTFPPIHFDFRPQKCVLSKDYLNYRIVESVEKAISDFNDRNYTDCIDCCWKATEKLTEELMKYLKLKRETTWGSNLQKIQKNLRKKGFVSIDNHWFIYYLITVVYFIRNPHFTDAKNIPAWMDKYQKMELNRPKWARIALICSLEASESFQRILEHTK